MSFPQKGGKRKSVTGPAQLFALGHFYLENDDVSDKAADNFKKVITDYPSSQEAAKAQFFLASYYQRKFYIMQNKNETKTSYLHDARREFEKYIEKYPEDSSCQCLSDAHFNLALVNLRLGEKAPAQKSLYAIKKTSIYDPAVYINQVVWSSNSKDVIDSHFDAVRLADQTYTISSMEFGQFVILLKKWCQSMKSRK